MHVCALHMTLWYIHPSVEISPDETVGIIQEANPHHVNYSPITIERIDTIAAVMEQLERIDGEQMLGVLGELFCKIGEQQQVYVSTDFLPLSLNAMKQLSPCGRSNIVYGLAKGLGTKRADGTDSLFPSNKVITGLFEYCVQFFNAGNNSQHVRRYKTYVYDSCITNSLLFLRLFVLRTTGCG